MLASVGPFFQRHTVARWSSVSSRFPGADFREDVARATVGQTGTYDSPVLVTYEFTVDDSGEEFGFVRVARCRSVAQLQRSEIETAGASKQGCPFGSGSSGLGLPHR